MSTHDLHVFKIGPDSIIAADEADAWLVIFEECGIVRGVDDYADVEAEHIPDTDVIVVRDDEANTTVGKTAAQWAASEPRGILCSEEW